MTDMLYNTQGIKNFQVETYLMKKDNLFHVHAVDLKILQLQSLEED